MLICQYNQQRVIVKTENFFCHEYLEKVLKSSTRYKLCLEDERNYFDIQKRLKLYLDKLKPLICTQDQDQKDTCIQHKRYASIRERFSRTANISVHTFVLLNIESTKVWERNQS